MSIEHVLVCSTGHITLADSYKLTRLSNTGPIVSDPDALQYMCEAARRYPKLQCSGSPLVVTSRPYGFLIYVPGSADALLRVLTDMRKPPFRLSEGLRRCMERAHLSSCGYLLLDQAGDCLSGLRTYVW